MYHCYSESLHCLHSVHCISYMKGECEPNYPMPTTLDNVDQYYRQYWRVKDMNEYRAQYE